MRRPGQRAGGAAVARPPASAATPPRASRARAAGLLLATLAGCACVLALAPPLLRAAGWPIASALTRLLFLPVCHQIPERAFHLLGAPLAVCARCIGCYAGFLAACIAWRLAGPAPAPRTRWLAIAAAPAALQWLVASFGGPDDNLLRGISGAIVGLAVALYIVPAFDALCGEMLSHRRRRHFLGDLHAKTR